jgi:hypothetical protein
MAQFKLKKTNDLAQDTQSSSVFSVCLGFFSGLGSVWFFQFQAYKIKTELVGFFKIFIGFFFTVQFFQLFFSSFLSLIGFSVFFSPLLVYFNFTFLTLI